MARITTLLAPLAAACGMFATAYSPHAQAAVVAVTNCHDSGPGSLRNAVQIAPDGATIDLRNVGCDRITLSHGQIEVLQKNLSLLGPGMSAMTLDGNRMYRVLRHRGTGTLQVTGLTIANGRNRQPTAYGGCLRSQGSVVLRSVLVCHCTAQSIPPGDWARGGAIYAEGKVTLSYSRVVSNSAIGLQGFEAQGGGIFSWGDLTMSNSELASNLSVGPTYAAAGGAETEGVLTLYRSRITRNKASAPQTEFTGAYAGAAVAHGGINAAFSSIDHNEAPYRAGLLSTRAVHIDNTTIFGNVGVTGAALSVEGPYSESVITQSTISGNVGGAVSGVYFQHDAAVYNSTVAFNRASTGVCTAAMSGAALYLDSDIIAKNACANDLAWQFNTSISNSLIGKPAGADWISADPRLAPLAYIGGPTPTHALLSGSPAIDRGANPLEFPNDQRGEGYPRVKGNSPDIGAVER